MISGSIDIDIDIEGDLLARGRAERKTLRNQRV
jgi:hypothetical protein